MNPSLPVCKRDYEPWWEKIIGLGRNNISNIFSNKRRKLKRKRAILFPNRPRTHCQNRPPLLLQNRQNKLSRNVKWQLFNNRNWQNSNEIKKRFDSSKNCKNDKRRRQKRHVWNKSVNTKNKWLVLQLNKRQNNRRKRKIAASKRHCRVVVVMQRRLRLLLLPRHVRVQ